MCEREFRDYKKRKLSQSDKGRGITVASTSTLIHTATSSVAANEWDEVWLKAVNTSTSAVKLTIQWGGTASPGDEIEITIQPEAGLVDVINGLVLNNAAEVRAFGATTNVIVLHGFVNRYEQTPTS